MSRRFLLSVFVAWIASLSSCAAPKFQSTYDELFARIDVPHDTLELILVEHGLTDLRDGAREQIRSVLDGKRVYPAGGGSLVVDVESILADETASGDTPEARAMVRALQALRVTEARLLLDSRGAPSLWRRFVVEHPLEFDELWNRGMQLPEFDEASLKLMRGARKAGSKPWSFQGAALVFDAPVSTAYAELCRDAWVPHEGAARTVAPPAQSFDGTKLRLRFTSQLPFSPDGTWSRSYNKGAVTAATEPELRSLLADRGFKTESEADQRSRFEKLGLAVEPQETYARMYAAAGLP